MKRDSDYINIVLLCNRCFHKKVLKGLVLQYDDIVCFFYTSLYRQQKYEVLVGQNVLFTIYHHVQQIPTFSSSWIEAFAAIITSRGISRYFIRIRAIFLLALFFVIFFVILLPSKPKGLLINSILSYSSVKQLVDGVLLLLAIKHEEASINGYITVQKVKVKKRRKQRMRRIKRRTRIRNG